MKPSRPLLEAKGLVMTYGMRRSLTERLLPGSPPGHLALDDVSIAVESGAALGIVGESGSGKTTLVRSLVGLVRPEAGSIRFDDVDVLRARGSQLAAVRRRLQLIYQNPYSSLNPAMSVGAAIAEPALFHGVVDKDGAERRVHELLDQVGLPSSVAARRPRELSGGQRQRVAIARALAVEPEMLIADEAVSALDVSIQAQVLSLLGTLREQLGLGLVFVSHQLATVAQLCDSVAIMQRGKVVERGPTATVFVNPSHPYTAALIAADPSSRQDQPLSSSGAR
jgi:ABC-type glutathione transport system ATPase component